MQPWLRPRSAYKLCRERSRPIRDEFSVLMRSRSVTTSKPQGEKERIVGENPTVETRTDRPYAAIPVSVTMQQLGSVVPPLTARVFDWLAAQGVAPAGPPFWRYVVIDMENELKIETGVCVASQVEGNAEVTVGVLPAGRYATVVHPGHPDTLVTATRDLLDWATERGLDWDADGDEWGCRLEEYLSDPAEVPDMEQWQTRLAFRLRD